MISPDYYCFSDYVKMQGITSGVIMRKPRGKLCDYCKGKGFPKYNYHYKVKALPNSAIITSNNSEFPSIKYEEIKTNTLDNINANVSDESMKKSGEKKKEVEWEGTVLLEKQNFLDLNNVVAGIGDKISELFGSRVFLQLVSSTSLDSETMQGRKSDKAYLEGWFQTRGTLRADKGTKYSVHFKVDEDFGVPGAILVENNHPNPFLLRLVALKLVIQSQSSSPNVKQPHSTIQFLCNSWIYNPTLSNGPRIFFTDKCYLPWETPKGVLALRSKELENKRGDGKGQRVTSDRVYDYDVYNDLGNPDKGSEYARPFLGGNVEFPYPRRCRTGRPSTNTDPGAESTASLVGNVYVPRDEQFRRVKNSDFLGSGLQAALHVILPAIQMLFRFSFDFQSYQQIDGLYSRVSLDSLRKVISPPTPIDVDDDDEPPLELFRQFTDPRGGDSFIFRFPVPQIIQVNARVWCEDSEFARQLLVGVNPVVIQRLKVFPPTSSLDPKIYGPAVSAITAKHVEGNLEGMTVDEALREKRLFILDYHDVYMPYVERINKLKGKSYGTRTLFFLTQKGTLTPLAIELSLPPSDGKPPSNRVLIPPSVPRPKDPLWELAKLHVILNDCGYHELVSHWLRSHASVEPFIIATHRQLSAMHPMYCLLVPHFKNTMSINAAARKDLINGFSGSLINGGIIEYAFSPGRYSMDLSTAAYKQWRFDEQALPVDLIKRGMAEEDPMAKHGIRLLIEDYPYAVDALDIWAAICAWAEEYVNIFYLDDAEVAADVELEEWWAEVRYKGHADKGEGWPELKGRAELAKVAATIMWMASAHHASVNFGQFGYGGFPPSRPTMGRRLIPEIGTEEYHQLLKNPDKYYLQTMSSGLQSLIIIATLEILSSHASNEEYLGQPKAYRWLASREGVHAALERFQTKIREAEKEMERRNSDPSLFNRCGKAGILYTILYPSSPFPGLSGRGIPNSTSI